MNQYEPDPLNTAGIELPEDINLLLEAIARNVHEVWAANRVREGWTCGERRDDVRKTHPCLIPYEELTEAEKDFDRRTSQEALKTIIAMGYKISKL